MIINSLNQGCKYINFLKCNNFYKYFHSPLNFVRMKFSDILTGWYHLNKRDLPWRSTKDPYRIWLSEIILQQTRISQGLGYYHEFIRCFPDIHALAQAKEQEVLKLWQGLGYYSRARNLHKTAIQIASENNGEFPKQYEELLKLKGIGKYTASAIASLAFNQPCPVADGNVVRFLSRFFGIKEPVGNEILKSKIVKKARMLMDKADPGIFNQALMEFGALYCQPKKPDCHRCIFNQECRAYRQGIVHQIPAKAARPPVKKRYFHYFYIPDAKNDFFYLRKRTANDIWRNLYDFPLIEKESETSSTNIIAETAEKLQVKQEKITFLEHFESRHILSHQVILARFYSVSLMKIHSQSRIISLFGDELIKVSADSMRFFPVPRLIEKFLKNFH